MKPSEENPAPRKNIRESVLQDFRILEGHALLELLNNPESHAAKHIIELVKEKFRGTP